MTKPTAFLVRRATAADVPALVDLRLAFDRELSGEPSADRAVGHRSSIEGYLESQVADGRYRVWVAEAAGQIVGMAGLILIDRPPNPRSRRASEAMVFNVMTDPAWRRRAVGRTVMEAVIADARALGCRRLLLRTSEAGSHLYAALGFSDPGSWRQLDLD